MASTKEIAGTVVSGLEGVWELSSPDRLSEEDDYLKFPGFELVRTAEGIRLHQESYVRDLLKIQYLELRGHRPSRWVSLRTQWIMLRDWS